MYRKFVVWCAGLMFCTASATSVYELIEKEHIGSLPFIKVAPSKEQEFRSWASFLTEALKNADALDIRTKRESYLGMMKQTLMAQSTLDMTTIRDLNLIAGPIANRSVHLVSRFDGLSTEAGRIMFMNLLMQPSDDLQQLSLRQHGLRTLLHNDELRNDLKQSLAHIAQRENELLSLRRSDPLATIFMSEQSGSAMTGHEGTAGHVKKVSMYYLRLLQQSIGGISSGVFGSMLLYKAFKEHNKTTRLWYAFQSLESALVSYFAYTSLRQGQTVFIAMQERMSSLHTYIDLLQKIQDLVIHYPELRGLMPSLPVLDSVLNGDDDAIYKKLIDLIKTDAFRQKPSLISNPQYVSLVLELLEQYKERFYQGLAIVGELDVALMSVSLLNGATAVKPWALPSFVAATAAPCLTIENGWNPFIVNAPVCNDFDLGANKPHAMLISGPNAGGKSTTMKGALMTALLAQTIGIVPAEQVAMTPFGSIATYLNIVDDVVAGNSFFKAGVIRAHEIISLVESSKAAGTFALIGLDEVFNGTAAQEGEAAAMALVEKVGLEPHTLCLAVTHFERVSKLAELYPQSFDNYCVRVDFDAQGSIVYRFKLEPGIADQQVAFKILQEEGFSADFLQRAKDHLDAIKSGA